MPGRSHSKKAHKETSTSSQGELLTSEPPSSSQRWQSIRPWRPPEGLSADESEITRLQVEVIDVSSTAVALAFLASDQQPNSQTANTSALPSGSSRSPEQTHSNPNKTTSLAVKLNNQPWPHVLHSDPAFFQDIEDATTSQGQSSPTASGATTIVIYGLRPGTCYAVQLEWQSQPEADALAVAESDQHLSTRPIVISTQSSSGSSSPNHTHESYYGPPPPYSSHDPSSPSVPAEPNSAPLPSPPSSLLQLRATEAELKASLAQLKERIKSQQSNLNAPLASIKRSFEKSAKEEQRARQRISTLEEATRKLRAMAIEEAEGANTLNAEDVEPLQAEAAELSAKLQERRAQVHKVEVDAKKAMRDDEQVLKSLDSDIEESQHRIDGLKTERNRYESEVVPDLTHRLDSLAEELRQQELDDHQQEARHQQLAAAAASSWYNFAHHSNSSTSLHAFPGAPVAVYAPTPGATAMNQPATAANSTSTTRRWPLSSNNMQRAPLRSMTGNTSAPEWSSSQMTSGVSAQRRESLDSALGLQQTATPQTVPGLLPRFGSDPTQLTTAAAAKSSSPTKSYATMSTPPLQANAEDAPRSLQASPPSASAGSRFLSGFRKRSTSSMAAPQHHDPSNLTNADIPPASEGEKKADKEDSGMLLALGSKLTRPSSSDSQSGGGGGGKMSWSRVVGKGRTSAAAP